MNSIQTTHAINQIVINYLTVLFKYEGAYSFSHYVRIQAMQTFIRRHWDPRRFDSAMDSLF